MAVTPTSESETGYELYANQCIMNNDEQQSSNTSKNVHELLIRRKDEELNRMKEKMRKVDDDLRRLNDENNELFTKLLHTKSRLDNLEELFEQYNSEEHEADRLAGVPPNKIPGLYVRPKTYVSTIYCGQVVDRGTQYCLEDCFQDPDNDLRNKPEATVPAGNNHVIPSDACQLQLIVERSNYPTIPPPPLHQVQCPNDDGRKAGDSYYELMEIIRRKLNLPSGRYVKDDNELCDVCCECCGKHRNWRLIPFGKSEVLLKLCHPCLMRSKRATTIHMRTLKKEERKVII